MLYYISPHYYCISNQTITRIKNVFGNIFSPKTNFDVRLTRTKHCLVV